MSLVGVDDGEDAGDRFAEVVAALHRELALLAWNLKVSAEDIEPVRTSSGASTKRLQQSSVCVIDPALS